MDLGTKTFDRSTHDFCFSTNYAAWVVGESCGISLVAQTVAWDVKRDTHCEDVSNTLSAQSRVRIMQVVSVGALRWMQKGPREVDRMIGVRTERWNAHLMRRTPRESLLLSLML